MSETAQVLGQVIVGLKVADKGIDADAVQSHFSITISRLLNFLDNFAPTVSSSYVTKPTEDEGWTGTAVLTLGAGAVSQMLTLEKPAYVEYWEPNSIIRLAAAWNDPTYVRGQWGLKRIGALDGWTTAVPTPVTVAIVDSGLMWRWSTTANAEVGSHEDLDGRAAGAQFPPRLWRSPEPPPPDNVDNDSNGYIDDLNGARVYMADGQINDNFGHGTMLAGLMFATSNNGLGIASPLSSFWPRITVMTVKFFDVDWAPDAANAKRGIEYAVDNGAKVINCSWHCGPGERGYTPIKKAIKYANTHGVLIVAAAGNDGVNNDVYPTYPAYFSTEFPNVLAVHATDRHDGKPYFSNYAPTSVHLGAPGAHIATTARYLTNPPRYKEISGTSAAAAFTSIAATLVLAIEYQRKGLFLKPNQVITHLMNTSDKVSWLRHCSISSGVLNLQNAVSTPF